MLDIFLEVNGLFDWIFECMIEGGEADGKMLFFFDLFNFFSKHLEIKGEGRSSEFDSFLI